MSLTSTRSILPKPVEVALSAVQGEVADQRENGPRRNAPVRVAIIGAGNRGQVYAASARKQPDRIRIVAIADAELERAQALAKQCGVPMNRCFESYQQIAARPGLADAVFNCTMDHLHLDSTLLLLGAGYDVLLEKPIARSEAEVRQLIAAARQHKRRVMICHVLRYAPFYQKVKQLLAEGAVGRILAMHSAEHVSYHHMAGSFVRGRWNRSDTSNPMIVAKCCHDMDLIAWFMEDTRPVRVASFGARSLFRADQAPAGAAHRCLPDCPIEPSCVYSAKRLYAKQDLVWPSSVWGKAYPHHPPQEATRLRIMADGQWPYGRCVWHCDNNTIDHQPLMVQFANGATASHDLFTNTSRPTRTLHIIGTHGEIEGDLTDGLLTLRTPCPEQPPDRFQAQRFDLTIPGQDIAGHGGGDDRLVDDFIAVVLGEPQANASTLLEHSLPGHQIAFAAEQAMQENRVIELQGLDEV